MNKEEYYRRLSRVEDRVEKCVVNPQFAHFCMGQSGAALAAFQMMGGSTGPLHMHKLTPVEIQALRDKDAPAERQVLQENNH